MSPLTDLVLANESDAEKIAELSPLNEYPGADIKGIDWVKLGMLHSILTGRSFEELLPQYEPIVEASRDGPWVSVLPVELVERLSQLDDAGIRKVAIKWSAIEEFEFGNWDLSEVHTVLDTIVGLARRATLEGKQLLMWMSL